MEFQSLGNLPTMLITLNGNSPDIHASRCKVLMPQSVLRLNDAAGLFRNYPRERMARLVNVNLLNTGRARVAL